MTAGDKPICLLTSAGQCLRNLALFSNAWQADSPTPGSRIPGIENFSV
jgi:hypothetical protein